MAELVCLLYPMKWIRQEGGWLKKKDEPGGCYTQWKGLDGKMDELVSLVYPMKSTRQVDGRTGVFSILRKVVELVCYEYPM
jgi:hypothetical protein